MGGHPDPPGGIPARLRGARLAAVVEGADGGGRVVVAQLLLVGAAEAQGAGEGASGGVKPGGGVLAGEGEVLAGAGAQEPQEGELGDGYRVAVRIHVGELGEAGREAWGDTGPGGDTTRG